MSPPAVDPGLSSDTSGLLLGFCVHRDGAGSELLPDHVLGQDTGAKAKPQPPRGIRYNTCRGGCEWLFPCCPLGVAKLFCGKMGERGKLPGASLIQSRARLWGNNIQAIEQRHPHMQ